MKKLHLLCNAHLDPAWLWRWNEGLAEAISTFRVAANFCDRYDGFIFNHNEALLYEWVEEHEPALFAHIQRLVKEGKWAIMGGWYLQPDCLMPSGESFFSQIEIGQNYFKEKFGITPTTAINFDPFGHSRGLIQIMKKCGYDSYIMMRPYKYTEDFWWEGFDGSRVLVSPIFKSYLSKKGDALAKIQDQIKSQQADTALCLWGIGNHGGGPSRLDLESIEEFRKSCDVELVHSTAEGYFADIDKADLPVIKESLISCHVGCYTSMARIKQANRRLENKLAMTEKLLGYAQMATRTDIDCSMLTEAKKALAFCQFHDILPGTAIQSVEEDGLRTFAYGEELADRLYMKAFFKLCEGQKKAKEGEIPVLVFNPHPYPIEGDFEVGFILQNQNWNEEEYTVATVYDEAGHPLPTQNEKPDATFHLDWPKKISFHATLQPSCINRFDCRLTIKKTKDLKKPTGENPERFTFANDRMRVSISRKTGLIEFYEVDGNPIVKNGGILEVYRDDEDPWGMGVDSFCDYEGSFSLMGDSEVNERIGYPEETLPNVRIIEDGAVRTKIQAFFVYKNSTATVEYTVPKQGTYLDMELTVNSQEPNRMLKYRLDTEFCGIPMGDTAFGFEPLYNDEKEATFQKWCGIVGENKRLYVLNRGTYGGSFTDRCIKLSLLRTPIYATHPIKKRQLAPHDRMLDHIDIGVRRFSFRLTTEQDVAPLAQSYNESPMLLSFFPSGEGAAHGSTVVIDNPSVLLSAVKKTEEGWLLRLYNSLDTCTEATVTLPVLAQTLNISFQAHEIKMIDLASKGT